MLNIPGRELIGVGSIEGLGRESVWVIFLTII